MRKFNTKNFLCILAVLLLALLSVAARSNSIDSLYQNKMADNLETDKNASGSSYTEELTDIDIKSTKPKSISKNTGHVSSNNKVKSTKKVNQQDGQAYTDASGSKKIKYLVKTNDTINKISDKFDINAAEIRRLNTFVGSKVKPGQTLVLTPGSKDLYIDVSIKKQAAVVYYKNKIIKRMTISSGISGYSTPLGTFRIQNRGNWFFSNKYQEGAKYWVSFLDRGVYLFHTIPMDENKNIMPSEATKLGQKASHGCIRLSIDSAKWIYENIPIQAKVVIH